LDMSPAHVGEPLAEDAEKLLFTMELSTLVSTNDVRWTEMSRSPEGEEKPPEKGKEK
jgi:hypothetical protein